MAGAANRLEFSRRMPLLPVITPTDGREFKWASPAVSHQYGAGERTVAPNARAGRDAPARCASALRQRAAPRSRNHI
jgi:hypothetical protein